MPTKPTPMLNALKGAWADRGWPLADLARYRMEDTGTPPPAEPVVPPPADPAAPETPPPAELGDAGQKALAAERAARAQAEKRAKAAEADLDKARKAAMSDGEKAVEAAKAEGRKTATVEFGQRLAAAKLEAALTGVVPDPAAIVEDLNLAKYVGDDGEPNVAAIATLAAKYAALKGAAGGATPPKAPPGSADNGAQGTGTATAVTRAQLKTMTQQQIAALPQSVLNAALSAP